MIAFLSFHEEEARYRPGKVLQFQFQWEAWTNYRASLNAVSASLP